MMPFFASRHTSQASNASVQRRKGQSFARNTTSNKKKRERREEKRREEKRERETHTRKTQTKREKQRES
tara:strand:- start:105 stop:311 length:207 start_codon:yes stop_codon:yes gene_type:complete